MTASYTPGVRVVALLAVRNEELYLARCLDHLLANGVEVHVIDNQSQDATLDIAQEYARRRTVTVESFPFTGVYPWEGLLRRKEQLAAELDADWFIHHDADEIRQAPPGWPTLAEGIAQVDAEGYNAINFAEMVFTPTNSDESFEGCDYVARMRHYYYFCPRPLHRVNAWKKTSVPVDLASTGGHTVQFPHRRIYPVDFVLRHYVFLSWRHLQSKYGTRRYDPSELAKGWHGQRAAFDPTGVRFPPRDRFKTLQEDGTFDVSEPWTRHFFLTTPRTVNDR
jgi:hypothetical protein